MTDPAPIVETAVCRKCRHIIERTPINGWGTRVPMIRGCAHIPSAESLRAVPLPDLPGSPDLAIDARLGGVGASRDEVAGQIRTRTVSPHGPSPAS